MNISPDIIHPIAPIDRPIYRPAADVIVEARRKIDFTKFSNANLKFAFDILCLHYSTYQYQALDEIQQRMARGEWLDLEKPPPPSHNLPKIFTIFPLNFFWKQRSGGGE